MSGQGLTAGIVCEYNPFHNGHIYQINRTRELTGCSNIVCVMSGSMVQRGDVAVFDKWDRAAAALRGGADLVLEIPVYYVLQSAQDFAYGAVELLSSLGIVDILSFGSESADIVALGRTADVISEEPYEFRCALEKSLAAGRGYPAAMAEAISHVSQDTAPLSANDILAVNYISAIRKMNANIRPFAVKRSTGHHSLNISDSRFASACAIRALMKKNADISPYLPCVSDVSYDICNIQSLILGFFRLASPDRLKGTAGMENGLENRLISCAKKADDLDSFFRACVTKRYTAHRIRRVALRALLGINRECSLDYVRVLGFNEKGKKLLSRMKESCSLPVVTKTADFSAGEDSMFRYDIMSTDIAALACCSPERRKAGRDYEISPIVAR